MKVRFNFQDRYELREDVLHLNGTIQEVKPAGVLPPDHEMYPSEQIFLVQNLDLPIDWIPSGDVEVIG